MVSLGPNELGTGFILCRIQVQDDFISFCRNISSGSAHHMKLLPKLSRTLFVFCRCLILFNIPLAQQSCGVVCWFHSVPTSFSPSICLSLHLDMLLENDGSFSEVINGTDICLDSTHLYWYDKCHLRLGFVQATGAHEAYLSRLGSCCRFVHIKIRLSHIPCSLWLLLPISWIIFICGTNQPMKGECVILFPGQ